MCIRDSRLYIDSLEAVLRESSKTIVDVGEDNILMLPLERTAGAGDLATDQTGRTLAAASREFDSRQPAPRQGR